MVVKDIVRGGVETVSSEEPSKRIAKHEWRDNITTDPIGPN
jgi:hypothetical protein